MLKGKKAVFFDMDGTLIDSVGIWNEIDYRLIYEISGKRVDEKTIQFNRDRMLRENRSVNNPYNEYCRYLKESYAENMTAQEIITLRYEIADYFLACVVDYKKDAEKLLEKLKNLGLILAITTTTKRDNMEIYQKRNENILSKFPLDGSFKLIYTRDDVKEIKPFPEVFLKAMDKLNLKKEECLVFEDSLVGAEAAKKAGIDLAVMYDRYSDSDREAINRLADYTFNDFSGVINAIDKEI